MADVAKKVRERTPDELAFDNAVTTEALRIPALVRAYFDVNSREKGIGIVGDRRYIFGNNTLVEKGCPYEKGDLGTLIEDMTGYLNYVLDGSFVARYNGREGSAYWFVVSPTLQFKVDAATYTSKPEKSSSKSKLSIRR